MSCKTGYNIGLPLRELFTSKLVPLLRQGYNISIDQHLVRLGKTGYTYNDNRVSEKQVFNLLTNLCRFYPDKWILVNGKQYLPISQLDYERPSLPYTQFTTFDRAAK